MNQDNTLSSSRNKILIEKMVNDVFQVHDNQSKKILKDEIDKAKSHFATRGTIGGGPYYSELCRLMLESLRRCIEDCIDEIETARKEANRKDSSILWDICEEILTKQIKNEVPRIQANLKSYLRTGANASDARSLAYLDAQVSQMALSIDHFARQKIASLKSKSIFIDLKTPEDRLSRGIPDVAVMMWFPNPENHPEETLQRANQKYKIIEEAVQEASNNKATVMKFDDPKNVPQDRIPSSVEEWLEKAVLVICDLEGNRPNVFYEFGYTRAVGTDLLVTNPKGNKPDHYLEQWQAFLYSDLTELKEGLITKIKKCIEKYDLTGDIKNLNEN